MVNASMPILLRKYFFKLRNRNPKYHIFPCFIYENNNVPANVLLIGPRMNIERLFLGIKLRINTFCAVINSVTALSYDDQSWYPWWASKLLYIELSRDIISLVFLFVLFCLIPLLLHII